MHDFIVRHAVTLVLTTSISAPALAQTDHAANSEGRQEQSLTQAVQDQSAAASAGMAPALPPAAAQLGQHVSGMAPAHPTAHGEMFGDCVSELAITGECSHHQR